MTQVAPGPLAGRVGGRPRGDGWIRALTAVVMVTLVVLVYAAVVGIGALFGRSGPPGLLLSIIATAVIALAFEPVRLRTRDLLRRVAHRDRVPSPQDVLAHFTDTVGGRYPTRELPARIATTLAEGTQARRAEVWLVVHDRLELAASWPDGALRPAPGPDGSPDDRVSLEVRERGELLGVLTVVTHPGQALSPVELRLFEGLAAQSGLMLRVTALRAELESRLAELQQRSADLRRSRRELVERQDAERQRLERNIHDGAQQEVIALLVNLRLVQTLLGRAPDRAMGLLAQQAEASRSTIRTLDELSRGLYPAALTEAGPVAALRAAAARSAVPVTVAAAELPRLPAAVEAALYFSCLEALQNAAKHSAATRVGLEIRSVPGADGAAVDRVEADIVDDGVGFAIDDTASATGRGLRNLHDRVESLHGTVRITSAAGRGTTVTISLPAGGGD